MPFVGKCCRFVLYWCVFCFLFFVFILGPGVVESLIRRSQGLPR